MTTTETTPAVPTRHTSDPAAPLTMPLGVLGALARCASADPQRLSGLNGVAINRAINVAMATDGKMAIIAPFPSGARAPAGVPLDILKAKDISKAEKTIPAAVRHRADARVTMTKDGATVTVTARRETDTKTAGKIGASEHDIATIAPTGEYGVATFPDIAAVLPNAQNVRAWVALDADMLATLAGAIRDAAAAIMGKAPEKEGPSAPVVLGIADAYSAIIVRSTGRTGVHGVIMPISPGDNVPRVADPETSDDRVIDARREQREAEGRLTDAMAELRAVRLLKERAERERDAALARLDEIRRVVMASAPAP